MAEFYFTAAIANGYEYKNTPDNYRHFLMELPVDKEELTYIFKEIGLDLDAKPGEYIFEIADFYLPGIDARKLFNETETLTSLITWRIFYLILTVTNIRCLRLQSRHRSIQKAPLTS